MSWEQTGSINEKINELKKEGYKIIALEQDKKAKKLNSLEANKLSKFVLIVGNEVEGIPRVTLGKCDEIIEIEMKGQKESMNVSVATGIALFNLI